MEPWNPRRIWAQLRDAIRGEPDDDGDDEPVQDPGLVFHLSFSAPLLLALLMTVQLLLQGLR